MADSDSGDQLGEIVRAIGPATSTEVVEVEPAADILDDPPFDGRDVLDNQALRDVLERLLDDADVDENDLQNFLEEHTRCIPTPHLLNHFLHFNSVVSKFKIDRWAADFAYLTKSSIEWRCVLVELEHPSKPLFRTTGQHEAFSAEFNTALAQVTTWKDTIADNPGLVEKRLAPLRQPMGANPLEFWYLLVIGRDAELQNHPRRAARLARLHSEQRVQVMTWDSLLRLLTNGPVFRKAILSETATGYRIKAMDGEPSHVFAYLNPSQLQVPTEYRQVLEHADYQMDAWFSGEALTYNAKWPRSMASDVMTQVRKAIAVQTGAQTGDDA